MSSFFLNPEEVEGLLNEGLRGKYKAAKLLSQLKIGTKEDVKKLIKIVNELLKSNNEDLEELTINKLSILSTELPLEILNSFIDSLTEYNDPKILYILGMIILRNSERVDSDISLEVSKRLIMSKNEQHMYLGLAILKEIRKNVNLEDISEVLTEIIKSKQEERVEIGLRILELFSNKIPKNELEEYLLHLYELGNNDTKKEIIKLAKRFKITLPDE